MISSLPTFALAAPTASRNEQSLSQAASAVSTVFVTRNVLASNEPAGRNTKVTIRAQRSIHIRLVSDPSGSNFQQPLGARRKERRRRVQGLHLTAMRTRLGNEFSLGALKLMGIAGLGRAASHFESRFNLGVQYLQTDQLERGVAMLEAAVSLPTQPRGWKRDACNGLTSRGSQPRCLPDLLVGETAPSTELGGATGPRGVARRLG